MVKLLKIGTVVAVASAFSPSFAVAQSEAGAQSANAEDPNDKAPHERSFEETRKHMQLHSEWSKKSGKMNDN